MASLTLGLGSSIFMGLFASIEYELPKVIQISSSAYLKSQRMRVSRYLSWPKMSFLTQSKHTMWSKIQFKRTSTSAALSSSSESTLCQIRTQVARTGSTSTLRKDISLRHLKITLSKTRLWMSIQKESNKMILKTIHQTLTMKTHINKMTIAIRRKMEPQEMTSGSNNQATKPIVM